MINENNCIIRSLFQILIPNRPWRKKDEKTEFISADNHFPNRLCGGEVTKAEVEMFNDVGDSLGTIKLQEHADGVKLSLNLKGLTPGIHGIHIHETNKCDAPDFQSAGNHFNPDNKEHGLLHPEGAHAGDLPNILVKEDGTVKAELMAPQVTLRDGKNSLFSKKGLQSLLPNNKMTE